MSQPAIFVSSMAALEKLKQDDPSAVDSATVAMGLSLGEYSALCFAGAFSFEDGVRLTKARGKAMQLASDAKPSGMVAVLGIGVDVVQKLSKKRRLIRVGSSCKSRIIWWMETMPSLDRSWLAKRQLN